ncbi:MAG: hypothetical protein PVF77_13800 [Anaerolineae bacterium]|jgi:hypothetical protein
MSPDRQRGQHNYLLKVEGELDRSWSGWFSGLTVTYDNGVSTLTGHVDDQAALRGILSKIWDLNLTLISVVRIEPEAQDANAQEANR